MAGPGQVTEATKRLLAQMLQQQPYADPAQQTPGLPPVMTMPKRAATVPATPPPLPPFQQPGQDFQQMQNAVSPPPQAAMPTMPPVTVTGQAPPMTLAANVAQDPQVGPDGLPTSGLGDLTGSAALASADRTGSVGLGDVRGDVVKALMQMQAQGKLPEQWRGSFSNQYGEPT